MRARAGRVDVPAEVVCLGLLDTKGTGDEAAAADGEHEPADAGEEAAPRGRSRDCVAEGAACGAAVRPCGRGIACDAVRGHAGFAGVAVGIPDVRLQ